MVTGGEEGGRINWEIGFDIWKWESFSCVQLFATPWAIGCQAPRSMEFSKQEYWSGELSPFPGDLPNPGAEPRSPVLQADSLPSDPPGKPRDWHIHITIHKMGFCDDSVVKNPPINAGDMGLIPGSGGSPRVGNGNPRQYSCLRNPMDRGTWQATAHEIAKNWTWLSNWTTATIYKIDKQ